MGSRLLVNVKTSTVALLAADILRGVRRAGGAISFPWWRRYRHRRQYVVVRMLGGIVREYWRGPYYRDGHQYNKRADLAYRHTTMSAATSAIAGCGLAYYSSTLMVVEL